MDIAMRKPIIGLVECAPRMGKTETLLHGIARYLTFRPENQVAYASYGSAMALRKSRITRDIAARSGLWSRERQIKNPTPFDPSMATAYWSTLEGGGLIAGGRRGQWVGEGFGLIVLDDVTKDREEAESPTMQKHINEDLFEGTLFTRRAPGGSFIICHQPWNENDLISYVREKFDREDIDYEIVSLPAVSDPVYDKQDRLIGGNPLWLKNFPIPAMRIIQAGVSEYNWNSQYQLNRIPRGDKVFREPQRYTTLKRDGVLPLVSCDPGIEKDEKKDPSAYVVGNCYLDNNGSVCIDIIIAIEVHEEIPEVVDSLEDFSQKHGNCTALLETVSAFKGIAQMARRLDQERVRRGETPARLNIVPITPKASKLVRAQNTSGGVKFGRVQVPMDAPWVPAFNKQLTRFTGKAGGKDNLVDALTQMYDHAEKALAGSKSKPKVGGKRVSVSGAF